MSLARTTLRDRVRKIVGNPKACAPEELADVSIEDELDAALRFLDRHVPNWALYPVTVGPSAQAYSVTTGVTSVLEVYWFGETSLSDIFGPGFDVLFSIPLYDVETGQYNRVLDWLAKEQRRSSFDWEFTPSDNKLWVLPIPTEEKTIYYLGAKSWTWDTIPASRQDLIVRYAEAKCLQILGRSRSKLSGVQRAGGLIDYSAVDALTRDGKDVEAALVDEVLAESQRWMALL